MKIALVQYRPGENTDANLNMALNSVMEAARSGAEIICFNQFFLGFIPDAYDSSLIGSLRQAAKINRIAIITGNLVVDNYGSKAIGAFIDSQGNLAAYEPEDSSTSPSTRLFNTTLGPLLVLAELEAYDSEVDAVIQEVKPKVILMQASAISLLELEAIKELTIDRSYNQAHLVLTVSMVGEFAGQIYLGTTMAVMQGQILGEADTEHDDLLIVDVNPDHFVDYQVLREPVTIPELLQQKLIHESSAERINGNPEAD